MSEYDVIIVGSGAAGLTAAIALADHCRVLVLAKGELTGGSTAWAQGGIAAVLERGRHVRGAYRRHDDRGRWIEPIVRRWSSWSRMPLPRSTGWSKAGGAVQQVDGDGDGWHLTREGGHSARGGSSMSTTPPAGRCRRR
jgi:L-aspartate oxidase